MNMTAYSSDRLSLRQKTVLKSDSSAGSRAVAGLLLSAALVLSAGPALGQSTTPVPPILSFQGYLTDSTGSAANMVAEMMFALYEVPEAGTMLWDEAQDVTVSDGIFKRTAG
jgi:hypothetical protein